MHSMLVLRRCQENPDTICPVYRQGCMVAIRATVWTGTALGNQAEQGLMAEKGTDPSLSIDMHRPGSIKVIAPQKRAFPFANEIISY